MQKHAKGHKYKSTNNVQTNKQSQVSRRNTERAPKNPEEGDTARMTMQPQEEGFGETRRKHLCQSGNMQPRKRALVKPEGSTYAGARSDQQIP